MIGKDSETTSLEECKKKSMPFMEGIMTLVSLVVELVLDSKTRNSKKLLWIKQSTTDKMN